MENVIGKEVTKYKDVICRKSKIGDYVMLADNVFVTDSIIGNHCSIERRGMIFNSKIDDYSYTGYNTVMKYTQMGKFCSVSWNVTIGGLDHEYTRLSTHPFAFMPKYGIVEQMYEGAYPSSEKPVVIGNDVWIAANACITRGVTIGDGVVIGAGSIVTHDVPPYEIWAGVPAKKIGQRFSNEIIEELLNLKWWDLPEDVLKDNLELFREDVTVENIKEIIGQLKG